MMNLFKKKYLDIKYFCFSSGSVFFRMFTKYEIDFINKKFIYTKQNKIDKEEKIFNLDNEIISLLKQKIYDLNYFDYNDNYVNIKIKDGHQWDLKIKYSNKEKNVHGDNKYPDNYDDLINIINLLKEKNNIQ